MRSGLSVLFLNRRLLGFCLSIDHGDCQLGCEQTPIEKKNSNFETSNAERARRTERT